MIDLDARLRRAGRILDDAMAAQPVGTTSGQDRTRPVTESTLVPMPSGERRVRRRVLAIAAAVAVVGASGAIALRSSDAQHTVTPAPAGSADGDPGAVAPLGTTLPAETSASAGTPITADQTDANAANASPIVVPDIDVPVADLTVPGAGLYLDPAVLPDGAMLTSVAVTNGGMQGSGGDGAVATTTLAQYSADRSQVLASVQINVTTWSPETMRNMTSGMTPTDTVIAGSTVYGVDGNLVWVDGDRLVQVVQFPQTVDLTAIATGLVRRDDGGFDAGWLPDGYEQVPVVPDALAGTGTTWLSTYQLSSDNDVDNPLATIVRIAHPWASAETSFAAEPGRARSATAMTIGGRRMIVHLDNYGPGRIEFDLADGSLVMLMFNPPDQVSDTDWAAQALRLAVGLRSSSDAEWAAMATEAASNAASLRSQEWARAPLDARGLVADGATRAIMTSPWATNIGLVPAVDADGSEWACEFLHQALLTCTARDAAPSQSATMVQPDLVRVVTSAGQSAQIRYSTRAGNSSGTSTNPLFLDGGDQSVAYFQLSGFLAGPAGCVDVLDSTGTVLGGIAIQGTDDSFVCDNLTDTLITTPPTIATNASVSPTNASVPPTNASVPEVSGNGS